MTEILTESFCERCGTRYTFETAQPKGRSLGALGTLGRGLRLFVTSSDSSLDESLAAARSEVEQRVTAAQLEAFHRTFNFCLSCRQYTCADCWNAVEGRCLTCAPLPEAEVSRPTAIAIPAPSPGAGAPLVSAAPPIELEPLIVLPPRDAFAEDVGGEPEITAAAIVEASPAAPVADLEPPAEPEPTLPAPELEPEAEVPPRLQAEPDAVAASEVEPDVALEAAPFATLVEPEVTVEVEAVDVGAEEPETEAAEAAAPFATLVEPEAEPEVAAPEPAPLAVEPEPEPEVTAPEPAPLAVEPEPVAVQPEPPSAPAESAPPGSVAGKVALPEFLPGRSLDDEIAAYELRVAAIVDAPSEPLPRVVIEATRPARGPSIRAEAEPRALPMTPPESLPAPATIATPGTCRACGLSISASARFCRRCGTAQQVA